LEQQGGLEKLKNLLNGETANENKLSTVCLNALGKAVQLMFTFSG